MSQNIEFVELDIEKVHRGKLQQQRRLLVDQTFATLDQDNGEAFPSACSSPTAKLLSVCLTGARGPCLHACLPPLSSCMPPVVWQAPALWQHNTMLHYSTCSIASHVLSAVCRMLILQSACCGSFGSVRTVWGWSSPMWRWVRFKQSGWARQHASISFFPSSLALHSRHMC